MTDQPLGQTPGPSAERARLCEELANAIGAGIAAIGSNPPLGSEQSLVWRKTGATRWLGEWQSQSTIAPALEKIAWKKLAAPLGAALSIAFPELRGPLGTSVSGWMQWNTEHFLRRIVAQIWEQSAGGDIDLPAESLRVCRVLEERKVCFEFIAPLINLQPNAEIGTIELAENLELRRLSEAEVTHVFGGPIFKMVYRAPRGISEWAFVGQFEEPITSGETESNFQSIVEPRLRSSILALRVNADGPVGYSDVHIRSKSWSPYVFAEINQSKGNEYIPRGTYTLDAGSVAQLRRLATWLGDEVDSTLLSACSRLSAAAVRIDPRDRLIDATIGLESVLLAPVTNETYRGELRYRFALNYSVHEPIGAERKKAFALARAIYDLRSQIAHGGAVDPDRVKLGTQFVTLRDAANRACEMLRRLLNRYLPLGREVPIRKSEYWESLLLAPESNPA